MHFLFNCENNPALREKEEEGEGKKTLHQTQV